MNSQGATICVAGSANCNPQQINGSARLTPPNTGGSPVDGSLAAAIACTLAGLALTLVARPRRR